MTALADDDDSSDTVMRGAVIIGDQLRKEPRNSGRPVYGSCQMETEDNRPIECCMAAVAVATATAATAAATAAIATAASGAASVPAASVSAAMCHTNLCVRPLSLLV